jgi:hypothetical protein
MGLKLRFTEGNTLYEVDDFFIDELRSLPTKVAMEIAKQIDWNADYLPNTKSWSNTYAGVVKNSTPPVFFLVEYLKEAEQNTVYLELELIDSDTYLDYYLENQTLI